MRFFRSAGALCVGLALALTTATASAQEIDPTGPYLSLGAGGAFHSFDEGALDFSHAPSFSPRAGWRIFDWLAFEVQYEFAGKFNDDSIAEADIRLQSTTGNFKLYPLKRLLMPYAIVGAGFLHSNLDIEVGSDTTELGPVVRLGAGIEAYTDSIVSFYLEATHMLALGDVDDFGHTIFGGGLIIRFNSGD